MSRPLDRPEAEAARIRREIPCAWCGGKKCQGPVQSEPHHSFCCMDQQPRPCWTTRGGHAPGEDPLSADELAEIAARMGVARLDEEQA